MEASGTDYCRAEDECDDTSGSDWVAMVMVRRRVGEKTDLAFKETLQPETRQVETARPEITSGHVRWPRYHTTCRVILMYINRCTVDSSVSPEDQRGDGICSACARWDGPLLMSRPRSDADATRDHLGSQQRHNHGQLQFCVSKPGYFRHPSPMNSPPRVQRPAVRFNI